MDKADILQPVDQWTRLISFSMWTNGQWGMTLNQYESPQTYAIQNLFDQSCDHSCDESCDSLLLYLFDPVK
ncbi:MAG: hypothetical protein LBB49_03580 [Gracilibacteraceae bacterium]|jgi:hypothetical protein|nr:hypothetical protein [Gracilibacteraceae bacterium]